MTDTGHDNLITDLEELLEEAKNFEFHDFKNMKYAIPKVELHAKLLALASRVKDGRYDNDDYTK